MANPPTGRPILIDDSADGWQLIDGYDACRFVFSPYGLGESLDNSSWYVRRWCWWFCRAYAVRPTLAGSYSPKDMLAATYTLVRIPPEERNLVYVVAALGGYYAVEALVFAMYP